MIILDQHDDTNLAELHRLSQLYQLPDYVKTASVSELVPDTSVPSSAYADCRGVRRYPIHNKSATYVSTLYFLEKQAAFPPTVRKLIGEQLRKAAEFWGIAADVATAVTRCSELDKQAEYPDSSYAMVIVSDQGKERRYPLRNSLEVKAAADWFCQFLPQLRQEFAFNDRATIAGNILRKAAEFGVALDEAQDTLERCSGKGVGSPQKIAQLISDRARIAGTPQVKVAMQALAGSTSATPKIFLDPASLLKLATIVDNFDRANGLLSKYSPGVPAPEDVIFEANFAKLSAMKNDACTTVTGSVYDKSQLAKLSASDVQDNFGDEIAKEVCSGLTVDPEKFAAIAATFPRPDAMLLDEMLQAKGELPVMKQAAASALGFSWADYKRMAANG